MQGLSSKDQSGALFDGGLIEFITTVNKSSLIFDEGNAQATDGGWLLFKEGLFEGGERGGGADDFGLPMIFQEDHFGQSKR